MRRSGVFGGIAACAVWMCLTGVAAQEERAFTLYDQPRVWPEYTRLRVQLMKCVREGNIQEMENVCRKGLELMPGDATWQYNLACALAYREKPDLAIEALEKAVALGFRDVKAMEADKDLKRISGELRFRRILDQARNLAGVPPPGEPAPRTARLTPGTKLRLDRSQLAWDFDRGLFLARFAFLRGNIESPAARSAAYRGPAKDLLAGWLADGTAAGNLGDVYVNRDRAVTPLRISDFPLLSQLGFDAEAGKAGVDQGVPNTLYPGSAVIGNASIAFVSTNDTCSLPRYAHLDAVAGLRLGLVAVENQFWVFPAYDDFDLFGVDRFPAVSSACLPVWGVARSEMPFLRAAAAASAAFRPETKARLLERHLYAPVLQWLFRRTRRGVETDEDYLTARAHPTAFDKGSLDVEALVKRAHELLPEAVPPAVIPFARPVPIPATDLERNFDFKVAPLGADPALCTYAWRVVHGDPKRVTFDTKGDSASIVLDCRNLTNRIDVAVFAKTPATSYGAPAFISFYPAR